MTDLKISVVINTYNASDMFETVLEHVRKFDEIVVCDMESTDNTVEIAKRYGARVVVFPKKDYTCCEPARNYAIQSASYKWVLVVDADEIIPDYLSERLYEEIKKADCPCGYYIPRLNKFMGEFSRDFKYDYQLRFFKKECTIWPPTIHSVPIVQGRIEKLKKLRRVDVIQHYANPTLFQVIDKSNDYTNNEVLRRQKKKYGVMALFYRPALRFFKNYIISGGFRMGIRGLIRAQNAAFYQWLVVAKIIEKRMQDNNR